MNDELTDRQRQILEWIAEKVEPIANVTVRDIGAAHGINSTNCAKGHLDALERKGFIRREKGKKGIRVLRKPEPKEAAPW